MLNIPGFWDDDKPDIQEKSPREQDISMQIVGVEGSATRDIAKQGRTPCKPISPIRLQISATDARHLPSHELKTLNFSTHRPWTGP